MNAKQECADGPTASRGVLAEFPAASCAIAKWRVKEVEAVSRMRKVKAVAAGQMARKMMRMTGLMDIVTSLTDWSSSPSASLHPTVNTCISSVIMLARIPRPQR